MSKKNISVYIVLVGCIMILIGSYMQWKDKPGSFQGSSDVPIAGTTPTSNDFENDDDNKIIGKELIPKLTDERLLLLTANQDEEVQNVFRDRLKAGEMLDFLIVGSTAMKYGAPGYAERLSSALLKTYGDFINITPIAIDGTSAEFIDQFMEERVNFNEGFDIVLFEPFTLNNNAVAIDNAYVHIGEFRERLVEQVEDAVIVLHPPYPIHAATIYPTQVSALKSFAASKGIPYIDHWQDWPDPDSEEILDYLADKTVPNSEGARVWANALINYFIAE